MRFLVLHVGSVVLATVYLRLFCHGFVSYYPGRLPSTTSATFARPVSYLLAEQLNVAFVTGNQMKVREIEMILSEMGAIDPENPQESLGENETPSTLS